MEIVQTSDEFFMRLALDQAHKSLQLDEVPIGAVVVCGGKVVARGHNLVESLSDATAHAEMQAITSAAATIGSKYLNECTIYVTVEPCPMCAAALSWCQIGEIVYGAADPKRGYTTISDKLIHPKTKVRSGVLQQECSEIVTAFFKKMR